MHHVTTEMADHDESGHDSHLHTWCRDGKYIEVEEYIRTTTDHQELEAKLVSRRGVYGYTPLHEAVSNGHHKMLDILVEHGADVNCRANSKYLDKIVCDSGKCIYYIGTRPFT